MQLICPKCDVEFSPRTDLNSYHCVCGLFIYYSDELLISGWELHFDDIIINTSWYWVKSNRMLIFYNRSWTCLGKIPYISPKVLTKNKIEKILLLK